MKKKLIAALISGAVTTQLFIPVMAAPHSNDFLKGTSEYTLGDMSISIPTTWDYNTDLNDSDTILKFSSKPENSPFIFNITHKENANSHSLETAELVMTTLAMTSENNTYCSDVIEYTIDDYSVYLCDYDQTVSSSPVEVTYVILCNDTNQYTIMAMQIINGATDYDNDFSRVLDSISFNNIDQEADNVIDSAEIPAEAITLVPGNYSVGEDIIPGKYDFIGASGVGVVSILDSTGNVNEFFPILSEEMAIMYKENGMESLSTLYSTIVKNITLTDEMALKIEMATVDLIPVN